VGIKFGTSGLKILSHSHTHTHTAHQEVVLDPGGKQSNIIDVIVILFGGKVIIDS